MTELKQSPPESVSAVVRESSVRAGISNSGQSGPNTAGSLAAQGDAIRSEKPALASGPKGAVQFPFLADGELVGVLQFGMEGHDYRDQAIAKGVYTMRSRLRQPVNGDHLTA